MNMAKKKIIKRKIKEYYITVPVRFYVKAMKMETAVERVRKYTSKYIKDRDGIETWVSTEDVEAERVSPL